MSTGKVLLGVLAGVAVGATLGVLFAPDKGSVTRKKILKKGDDYGDDLKEKFEDLISGFTQKFEAMTEEASEMAEKGKAKMEEMAHDMAAATNGKV